MYWVVRCSPTRVAHGCRSFFLTQLVDVEAIRSYAWGTAALAYLYRQLGLATRHEVKQISDYLTLLEAWVYEHFECLAPTPNILYLPDQPRVHRWFPRRESAPLQGLRERIDSMSNDQVITMSSLI